MAGESQDAFGAEFERTAAGHESLITLAIPGFRNTRARSLSTGWNRKIGLLGSFNTPLHTLSSSRPSLQASSLLRRCPWSIRKGLASNPPYHVLNLTSLILIKSSREWAKLVYRQRSWPLTTASQAQQWLPGERKGPSPCFEDSWAFSHLKLQVSLPRKVYQSWLWSLTHPNVEWISLKTNCIGFPQSPPHFRLLLITSDQRSMHLIKHAHDSFIHLQLRKSNKDECGFSRGFPSSQEILCLIMEACPLMNRSATGYRRTTAPGAWRSFAQMPESHPRVWAVLICWYFGKSYIKGIWRTKHTIVSIFIKDH